MKKSFILTITVASLLSSITDAQAASLVIDEFSNVTINPQEVIVNAVGQTETVTDLDTDLNNVIGGSRRLELFNTANNNPQFAGSSLKVDLEESIPTTFDKLTWSNGPSVESKASVYWNANGDGLDLDLTSNNGIDLEVFSIDQEAQQNVIVTWTLVDGNQNTAVGAKMVAPGTVNFAFNPNNPSIGDFIVNGDFDFTDVDEVSLMLDSNGSTGIDATFERASFSMAMSEIPEPSTVLAIFGVTILGRTLKRQDKDDQEE